MSPIASDDDRQAQRGPIQNRRVMSSSSGFGVSSAVIVRGSSAMPQIGQAPGASRTHLRMHRAGVGDTRDGNGGFGLARLEEFLRVRLKSPETTLIAEVVDVWPSYLKEPAARAGSTVIPQTGSTAVAV